MADKILIVDDDPETVKLLSVMLTRMGYQPLAARDGLEALNMATQERPDLIVLDVMMPDIDGYEVARRLRRHPETLGIPILMFTAKTQTQEKLAGYEAGVDLYLTKPIHPIELQAHLRVLLTQKHARVADRGYVVGVMGSKGGLGVSTVALNLAITYHKSQKEKVIAAELKPGQGSWVVELGLERSDGLVELLKLEPGGITSAAVEKRLLDTVYGIPLLLASTDTDDVQYAAAVPQFEAIVERLPRLANLVVLDIGTNFHPAIEVLVPKCNEFILVTEPQPIAVQRARALVDELKIQEFGSTKALTVITVNRARADITLSVSEIEDELRHGVTLGFPPVTELAHHSAKRHEPLCLMQPEGSIAKQFNALSDLITKHAAQFLAA